MAAERALDRVEVTVVSVGSVRIEPLTTSSVSPWSRVDLEQQRHLNEFALAYYKY
jgi:hypothetical protein